MNRTLVRPEVKATKVECEFKVIGEFENNGKSFAIYIGEPGTDTGIGIALQNGVAQAMAIVLEELTPPEPSMFELTGNLITALGYRLDGIYIDDMKVEESRYLAKVLLSNEENYLELDWTSGEALAIALQTKCPIYVADNLYKKYLLELGLS